MAFTTLSKRVTSSAVLKSKIASIFGKTWNLRFLARHELEIDRLQMVAYIKSTNDIVCLNENFRVNKFMCEYFVQTKL